MMALVEITKGSDTSEETTNTLAEFAKKLGKMPVIVKKDSCGFIVNRILGSVFNEAFWAYRQGETTKEGIDASIKYTGGFPMGLFEFADFLGLDTVYAVAKALHAAYGERLRPCSEIIEPLVRAHNLGQKTGVGFYNWAKGRPQIPVALLKEYDISRTWAVAVNEAAWLIHDGAAAKEDIDVAMKLGAYWPIGPWEYASKTGLREIVDELEVLCLDHDSGIYSVCPLLKQMASKGPDVNEQREESRKGVRAGAEGGETQIYDISHVRSENGLTPPPFHPSSREGTRCISCGVTNDSDANYCRNCGVRLQSS